MAFFSVDAEPDMASELIDLAAMPLAELRTLDDEALHRSMRHVVERTAETDVRTIGSAGTGGGVA